MIRISLTTTLLIVFAANTVQAESKDIYSSHDAMTSTNVFNSSFIGEPVLIAKGGKDKGNGGSGGHGGKNKDHGDNEDHGNSNKGGKEEHASHGNSDHPGNGNNKKYPGAENNKKLFANSALPGWAHDCGLPPGLAKQNKVPPGWQKKCEGGLKYYDNPDAFRLDLFKYYGIAVGATVTPDSPIYQSLHAMDEADCQVSSMVSAGDVLKGAAVGAVYGGMIGAGTGAVVGAATDNDVGDSAVSGAEAGALTGAVVGGIVASQDYKKDYSHCMHKSYYYSEANVIEQPIAKTESEVKEVKKWWEFWK